LQAGLSIAVDRQELLETVENDLQTSETLKPSLCLMKLVVNKSVEKNPRSQLNFRFALDFAAWFDSFRLVTPETLTRNLSNWFARKIWV
jgi:hypothetical protein